MFDEFNILKLFFEEPNREFNVREIARILKISPPTISSKLKSFVKLRILKYRKKRILDLYKSDLDSEDYLDLKRFYLLRQLKEIGLIDYLNHFYLKPTIVLFGSCADGLDTELSDIDLVIISENSKIADLKNLSFGQVASATTKNAKNLFRI